MTQEIKSITTKSVYGKADKSDIGKEIMKVYGYAANFFIHETKYGENKGLKGYFVAINPQTGEVFESRAAFLPDNVTDSILTRLKEGETEVEFTCTIEVAESDKNDRGIAYIAEEPLTEQRKSMIAKMREYAEEEVSGLITHNSDHDE